MPEFPIREIALLIEEIRHEGGLAAAGIEAWDGLR
jgi:hypothetical protein